MGDRDFLVNQAILNNFSQNSRANTGGYNRRMRNNFKTAVNSSGLLQYFNTPQVYKKNLASAKRGGRALGLKTGYRWVVDAGKVS